MKDLYFEVINQIERLHRLFLDVVSKEIARIDVTDINNVQALILYNVGENKMTISELTQRGYYLGSNVSYNVKKLVTQGYLDQEASSHDKRASFIKATNHGLEIFKHLDQTFGQQAKKMCELYFSHKAFPTLSDDLKKIEIFWRDAIFR